MTGNFCDGGISVHFDSCFASERVPADYQSSCYRKMRTPLCTFCETQYKFCRFCRKQHSCTPPNTYNHWSGLHPDYSRQFTPEVAAMAIEKQRQKRDFNEDARKMYHQEVPAGFFQSSLYTKEDQSRGIETRHHEDTPQYENVNQLASASKQCQEPAHTHRITPTDKLCSTASIDQTIR